MHRPTLALSATLAAVLAAACARSQRAPAPSTPPSPPPAPAASAAAPAPACSTADLVVAATTDVHGRLRSWDYYADAPEPVRGLTRAATVVDSVRAANPGRVLLVDAGDLLQGNPLAYVAARVSRDTLSPIVAAMNAMRYDAAAIGNHEYNYGVALLERAVGQATFPFLSANTYRVSGGRAFPAFRIVERAGVKVGIVAATTPGVSVWDRDNVAGRLEFRDILPEVRQGVADARAAGAEVVVVVLHSGLDEPSSYDTVGTGVPSENVSARVAREVPGIDLIVFGHSHKELVNRAIGSTMLLQPRNWATSVGVAHLAVAGCAGARRVDLAASRAALVPAAGHGESPAVLAATERVHRETVDYATTPIGATPVAWRGDSARVADTPLIDFVLEVERKAAGADLASTAAFSLDAALDAGPVTVAELARLYPYDNTLRAVRISGKQLKDYLEHSSRYYRTYAPGDTTPIVDPEVPGYNFDIVAGADYVLDLSRPIGARVTKLTVRGRPVAPADSFTLALNNYRQTGGGGFAMLRGARVVYDRQQEIRQLLIDEVRRRKTIRPTDYFRRNWRLEPPAAVAKAYAPPVRRPAATSARAPSGASAAVSAPAAAGGPPPPGSSPTAASVAAPESRPPAPDPATPPRPGATRLRIVATNDFHGALEARPDAGTGAMRGGAAAMAAAIEQAARDCGPGCQTLLVDGGDMFQGTPASNLAFGRPVVELYDTLGYAAAALGNHEFDWGQDTLRARMRDARFAILGANVRYADGRDVEWVRNDTIVRRGPLRVGIVGVAMVATAANTLPANVAGLRFDDPVPIVDSISRALRARGADAVVLLAHEGAYCDRGGATGCKGEIMDIARRLTQPVDAIVSGHTHSLIDVAVRGIPVVQARTGGRAVAVLDLDIVPRGTGAGLAPADGAGERRAEVRDVLAAELPPEPRAEAIVRRAVAAVAPRVGAAVGTIAEAMPKGGDDGSQYPLGNFIADAHRWAGKGDIAIMNNGGIRAGLRAGPATYGTLYEVAPFGNVLYRITATGAAVRSFLEHRLQGEKVSDHLSGIAVVYDPARPAGARIVSATLADGRPLSDRATYRVVMNDFIATGKDGLELARAALSSENTGVVDLDALIGYIRSRRGPVTAPAGKRIEAVGTARSTRAAR
ncbi:MAG: 5'-nucleotidase C-terminal domain-containing protein [Gemmatimonadaceae bacterium]